MPARRSRRRTVIVVALVGAALWVLPAVPPLIAPTSEAAVFPTCAAGPATVGGVPRFWTTDRTCYDSPWFEGSHRIMIPFGCTLAPYYPRVAACSNRGGIHHGLDIDMAVGTRVYSNVAGTVVKGTLGSAYGSKAFLVRTAHYDYVLGHVGTVFVTNGQRVSVGQLLARSDQLGAPDGPHLHLEVRPRGGTYVSAIDPTRAAHLTETDQGPRGCC